MKLLTKLSLSTSLLLCLSAAMGHAQAPKALPLLSKHQLIEQVLAHMVHIQAGTYRMGTSNKKYFDITSDNAHPHKVTLSSFYFSKYLTSANELNSYLKLTNQIKLLKKKRYNFIEGDTPALGNWHLANGYCTWLAHQTGLPFNLPTEAQWEYVARDGGKDIAYPTPNGKLETGKNYPDSNSFIYKMAHKGPFGSLYNVNNLPVTQFPTNQLGIHQMGGNVNEWMQDWYVHDYYWHSPVNNPQGPKTYPGTLKQNITRYGAPQKVVRGINNTGVSLSLGGHDPEDKAMLIAGASNYSRNSSPITAKDIGFRCVINSDKSMSALKAVAQQHLIHVAF
jgi:sulfatase modifying factor 1